MLIFRYLAKEVFLTLIALTAILVLIFMSNELAVCLNSAAKGNFPLVLIMKLLMVELPIFTVLLLPLGLYISLLLAYGRLYAESEMTVLQACGYGPKQLMQHSFMMATIVAIPVMIVMLWVSPYLALERDTILRTTGIQTIIQTIVPGRFHSLSGGRQVYYVGSMSRDHRTAKHVFLARFVPKNDHHQWDVLWATSAYAESNPKTNENYVILEEGKEYQGVPGEADFQVAEFKRFRARLPHPRVDYKEDIRTDKTAALWPVNNPNLKKAAELQWRFSIPLMIFTLTLIGVPLSRVNPRMGKYAKLLPAIVIFILYANFMFIARDWFSFGRSPVWLGMWWIHALAIILGLVLVWRNYVRLS